ncbi:MAG: translation initiation factor IF-2 [Firmicutes bacterium]|nr:translation initiation factor IF-2 [Bacillota bacterium]
MAEETKIVKKETKSDQAKTGASKVQIRQVDIAIIQAQREKAMKEGQKKAEASQKKAAPAARKDTVRTAPIGSPVPRSAVPVGKPMPKAPVGTPMPKAPAGTPMPKPPVGTPMPKSPIGKPMPKSAVPQKKADVPQPVKAEAPSDAKIPEAPVKTETPAVQTEVPEVKLAEEKPVKKPAAKKTATKAEAPAEKQEEKAAETKIEKPVETVKPEEKAEASAEEKKTEAEKPADEIKAEEKKTEDKPAEQIEKAAEKPEEKTEAKAEEKPAVPEKKPVDYVPNIGVKIISRAADQPQTPQTPRQKPSKGRDGQRGDDRRRGGQQQDGQKRTPKEFVGKKKDGDDSASPRRKQAAKTDARGEKVVAYTAPANGDKRGRKSKDKDREKDDRGRNKFGRDEAPADLTRNIKKKHSKYKEAKVEEVEVLSAEVEEAIATGGVVINVPITLAGFCEQVECTPSQAIMALMKMGIMANVNQNLDEETAVLLGMELGINVAVKKVEEVEEEEGIDLHEDTASELQPRPPIVTVMGHVDHGKTSILDAIRKTNVTAGEAGGITQHIGASEVVCNGQRIVFLDTPGHEAFTAMRARGAHITDIAVLVVAADDSVMPQTIESISHAKAANVPIIVAMNKMDKPAANPDLVKKDLADQGLIVEDWGGDVICVPCSAKTGMGIQQLLEMILLQAEVLELKANPDRPAMGTVIEARLDKARGPVASLLVMNGTLQAGAALVAGTAAGRVRVMTNDKGETIREAGPATAVEITGLTEVPEAGDEFYMVKDDKTAREIAYRRSEKLRAEVMAKSSAMSLEKLFGQLKEGEVKDLNLIIKADVQGSVGALEQSLEKLQNENVRVRIIHSGVGTITEGDVMLASTSNAVIIGFNVRPSSAVSAQAEQEDVEIRTYRVIYEVIDDIEAAMKGMLNPIFKEVVLGKIEVRNTFKVPNVGIVAGGYVLEGKVVRGAKLRLVRDGIVIHEGEIGSLKRFKDDVKEVAQGYECGIGIEKYNDIKEGDIIEAFKMEEVKRD